ncbi:hypothetical protein HG530_005905 [Fusarium avenaceum]|nr:hypothetical protein HG530_005905 [Fusarium avenaceum]
MPIPGGGARIGAASTPYGLESEGRDSPGGAAMKEVVDAGPVGVGLGVGEDGDGAVRPPGALIDEGGFGDVTELGGGGAGAASPLETVGGGFDGGGIAVEGRASSALRTAGGAPFSSTESVPAGFEPSLLVSDGVASWATLGSGSTAGSVAVVVGG